MDRTLFLVQELVKLESITPNDAGCQDFISACLTSCGFTHEQMDYVDTKNSWYRRGTAKPLFVFLGHTDVVPVGDPSCWLSPPFMPTITNDRLFGRGVADMKGAIAAFIVAVERFVKAFPDHQGSIAMLLTSDEEGIATNGVVKVVEQLEQRHEKIDWCLVGEPSCKNNLGDVLRVGRRGSLCAKLTIYGVQGHVAYPDLAENPIHTCAPFLQALVNESWDQGNTFFPPSRLQISNIHSGTGAENVIPGELQIQFNIRFSTELNEHIIKQRVDELLTKFALKHDIEWRLSGQPFLTEAGELVAATELAIKKITGIKVLKDTGGGTSDGRFIAPTGAQVVEFGLLNETIHKINENILVTDLALLADIYEQILINLLLKSTK